MAVPTSGILYLALEVRNNIYQYIALNLGCIDSIPRVERNGDSGQNQVRIWGPASDICTCPAILLTCHQLYEEAHKEWYRYLFYPLRLRHERNAMDNTFATELLPSHFGAVKCLELTIRVHHVGEYHISLRSPLDLLINHLCNSAEPGFLKRLRLHVEYEMGHVTYQHFQKERTAQEDFVQSLQRNLNTLYYLKGLDEVQSSLVLDIDGSKPDPYSWSSIKIGIIFRQYMDSLEVVMTSNTHESVTTPVVFSPGWLHWRDHVTGGNIEPHYDLDPF